MTSSAPETSIVRVSQTYLQALQDGSHSWADVCSDDSDTDGATCLMTVSNHPVNPLDDYKLSREYQELNFCMGIFGRQLP